MRRTTALLAIGALGVGIALRARSRQRSEIYFCGQTVVIMGGSRGLGLALAREFAQRGARIALCGRDAESLQRARDDLRRWGAEVFAATCDVANREDVTRFVDEVARRFGRIDVLVNNASIIQVGPLEDMTIRDFEDAMAVNFWGMVHATLAVVPEMQRRGHGRVVNITSIGGKVSVPRLLPYSSAKFAAVGFSEGLRTELAASGIQVLTVVPGLMRTGSYLHALFKGNVIAESRWFALASTLPLISMASGRAARQIVRAAGCGDTERTLSVPATVLARVHGVAPALTVALLTWANGLLLPRPVRRAMGAVRAIALERAWPVWMRAATVLGHLAGRDLNQLPPSAPPLRRRHVA